MSGEDKLWSEELEKQSLKNKKEFFENIYRHAENHVLNGLIKLALIDQAMKKSEQKVILKFLRKSKKKIKERKVIINGS